jgi:predicted GIY-YIG superfamily endonuclease
MKAKDIKVGDRFSKWLVTSGPNVVKSIDPNGKKRNRTNWDCFCTSCGTTNKKVVATDLVAGKSTKCLGCMKKHNNIHEGFVSNDWIVKRRSAPPKSRSHWLCRCKCGKEVDVYASDLNNGKSKRCLECGFKSNMKHPAVVVGKRYNKWTAIKRCTRDRQEAYECECVCGYRKKILGSVLRSGKSRQCRRCASIHIHGFRRSDFILAAKRKNIKDKCMLYIIECSSGDELFYKIGITTNTIEKRYPTHNTMPYKYTIKYSFFSSASIIWDLEKELHKNHKESGFHYVPIIVFGGMYECFSSLLPDIESMLK